MSSKEERRQTWIARVTAYKQSGQTMKVWCSEQGVTLDQLKYWLRKFKSEAGGSGSPAPTSFVPLVLNESSSSPSSASLRLHVGDVHIEVNVGFNPGLLRDVVATLRPSC
jgi:transposase-like protein